MQFDCLIYNIIYCKISLSEKLKTLVTWPEDWLVADYHCTGSDFKPLVLIPALAALGVKVPCLLGEFHFFIIYLLLSSSPNIYC